MNAEWQAFLNRAGVAWGDGPTPAAGQLVAEGRAALTGDICCDRSRQGLIAARGPDSEVFLQGQLTCDVRQVTPERSLIGAYCTPKGRALACFRIFRREEGYYLALPAALVEPTLARLRHYVLRAKTGLEDASATLARMGLSGPTAARLLSEPVSAAVQGLAAGDALSANEVTVIRLPGHVPRFEVHGPARALAALWERCAATAAPVGEDAWRLLDILAGIPSVYPETVEAFVPQMLNLEWLGGISFQKGCYTGQEIVARAHYLGKLKRRMVLARVDSPTPPRPGAPLFSAQADAGQGVGQLVDAALHPDGGHAVLAVALLERIQQDDLRLSHADGPRLRLEPLPYHVEPAG